CAAQRPASASTSARARGGKPPSGKREKEMGGQGRKTGKKPPRREGARRRGGRRVAGSWLQQAGAEAFGGALLLPARHRGAVARGGVRGAARVAAVRAVAARRDPLARHRHD